MKCSNCGATGSGPYCSACGRRILTPIEAYNRDRRREERAFIQSRGKSTGHYNIARACWDAAAQEIVKVSRSEIDYEGLEKAKAVASALFARLEEEIDKIS